MHIGICACGQKGKESESDRKNCYCINEFNLKSTYTQYSMVT
jgi:hypothetical protein